MSVELSEPIRAAILAEPTITALLPVYLGSRPVFTRAPVPDDAPYPLIVAHAQMAGGAEDGLRDQRPIIIRDVTAYGYNDTPEHYRAVETIAEKVWELFDRSRGVLTVPGWTVAGVSAQVPRPAPTDDEETVARRVELRVRLARPY